ncbi:hypothetical protein ABMA10_08265 [Plantibacter sp. RU18]
MSTSASTSRSRNPFSRQKDDGPRASLKQLMPYIFEHRSILIVVIILSIVGAAASLAQPLIVSQVIGVVEAGRSLGNLAWLLVGLVVVSGVISGYQHYLLQRAGTGVVYSSRRQLIARIFRLPISQFDTRRTGDLVSRVGSDTTMLYAVLTQGFVDAVGGAVTFLGALIAMAIIDPVLLGLTLLVVIVSVVVVVALSGRIRVASREQQTKVGELAAAVERAISSIRTIRASNATDREIDAVDGVAKEVYGVGVRIAKISSLVVPVAGIAMQTSFLVVLGVGGFRVASGAITIASLVAFILFLFMMIMPLGQAFGAITSVNQALGALGRIQEILDLPDEGDDDASIAARVERPGTATAAAPTIEFDGVEFAYPDAAVIERERAAAEALATDVLGAPARTTEAIAADAALLTEASSAAGRQVLRGGVLRGDARPAHRPRRPLRRGEEHDPRPHRTVLRPDRRRDPPRRCRHPDDPASRAARADRLCRAGRSGARRHAPRQPAALLPHRDRRRVRARAARREPRRGPRPQPSRSLGPRRRGRDHAVRW